MVPSTADTACDVTDEFIARLAERAQEGEQLRRLPPATVEELKTLPLLDLLLPERYGGRQASFPTLFDPIRRMAHGCTSSAWTIGFYALHNWMLSLFSEQAQDDVLAGGRVLAPAPLAPSGRGRLTGDGIRLSGRWSWATGIMDADWAIVGVIIGSGDAMLYPALAVLPIDDVNVEDVWHTAGMRATGSNDVIVGDVFVPGHRIVKVSDIYAGDAPGAAVHNSPTYRWPMVPALALTACMPVLGTAEYVVDLFTTRVRDRVLAYSGVAQRDQPAAQIRLAGARVRLGALRGLIDDIAGQIELVVIAGDPVSRSMRAQARLAAAHAVHESRAIIADVLEAAGASAHFLDNPLQRAKRDVDIASGHVVFDYDVSRELAGALAVDATVSPTAMI
jgi:alkylation response protein AidB-like acyl-CoA dehydrogenase